MLLCEKFQARFGGPQAGPALILLNEAAIELAVPRRRLYDIINVLEAVEVHTLFIFAYFRGNLPVYRTHLTLELYPKALVLNKPSGLPP